MQVAIPKLTFRIHDNPLLENTDLVVFIIEKERLPTLNYQKSVENCSWSFHQFNLLLQVLIGLDEPRVLPILVDRADLATVFQIMNQNVDRVVTDYTTDPAFHIFDETLDKVFGQKLDYLSTFTLLDWREPVQQKILTNYWTKTTVYAKLTPLKEHILSKPITSSTRKLWAPSKLSFSNILERYRVDLPKLLKHVQNIMVNNRMHPHSFSFGSKRETVSWDSNLLSYVQKQVALIDQQGWYKPDTAIGVDFGWKIDGDNLLNGSQLSPFLSIGALSVKTFWTMIKSNEATMGSAKDQLLFRECFHATAIAAETISVKRAVITKQATTDRITHFWDNTYNTGFGKESDIVWNNDPVTLKAWQEGALVPSDEWFDTNDSMRQLWVNGWIHHLRRHLVADVLTRGQLGIDWRHGERWFRHTLIDHDAAVNRANWMWLAAVAFSSKQKIYHYSPDDYVRRKSHIAYLR